eukprot:jgi/Picre1/32199/NNA_007545.t1
MFRSALLSAARRVLSSDKSISAAAEGVSKIDFARYPETTVDGIVQRIEYDPNRSARIALLHHQSLPEGTPRCSLVGGQLGRSAGTACTLVKKGTDGYAVVKLPSGEQKLVLLDCMATIGALSNPQHKNRKLGKAGASRWLGRRPKVRGVAMNCVDHPHGGGRVNQRVGFPKLLGKNQPKDTELETILGQIGLFVYLVIRNNIVCIK